MPTDDDEIRRELHEALDSALESLEGVVGIVVLVEYMTPQGTGVRRELVIRSMLTTESMLTERAIAAVRKI